MASLTERITEALREAGIPQNTYELSCRLEGVTMNAINTTLMRMEKRGLAQSLIISRRGLRSWQLSVPAPTKTDALERQTDAHQLKRWNVLWDLLETGEAEVIITGAYATRTGGDRYSTAGEVGDVLDGIIERTRA